MSIPLTIDQLLNLENYKDDSTELIEWFKQNGFLKVFEISKILKFPVFKEESLNRQVLRSWVGRKILSELSNTILVPNDKDGIKVFNTIEGLLEVKKDVSTLDILKALPSEEITLDIDNLILIISSWKKELAKQQSLNLKLKSLEKPIKNSGTNILVPQKGKLNVWLIVGVNGVGKTTTLGKLAYLSSKSNYKTLIAAADTFRAAAVEQLQVWGNRSKVDVISNQSKNADPAAVVFDAINAANKRKSDLLLVDTAGRLQNKNNLMDELSKIKKLLIKKFLMQSLSLY